MAADALSRNNMTLFLSLASQIPQTSIPQPVRVLLVDSRPSWGTQAWTDSFKLSLTRASPVPDTPSTHLAGSNIVNSPHTPPLRENALRVCSSNGSIRLFGYNSDLSALRFFQIRAGLQDPSLSSFPRLTYVLKGIHRSLQPKASTTHNYRKLHKVWSVPPIPYDHAMLWAACCVGFFGFLRAGEFTCTTASPSTIALSPSDVIVDPRSNPRLVTLHLRSSKTDLFGAGCQIYLGRTDTVPCPVAAILNYLSRRPDTPGPLFLFFNSTPLTRVALVTHLRTALSQAGIDSSRYSGHSFRIGAASAAAKAGYSDSFIRTLGRWKSAAFIAYIRTQSTDLAAVSPTLASCVVCNRFLQPPPPPPPPHFFFKGN